MKHPKEMAKIMIKNHNNDIEAALNDAHTSFCYANNIREYNYWKTVKQYIKASKQ